MIKKMFKKQNKYGKSSTIRNRNTFFSKKSNFKNIFPYNIDFTLPGFEKSYPKGVFKCLSFSDRSSEEWFLSFVSKVENSIGKKFLPIYRMSDGEFQFCVGYKYPYRAVDEPILLYILRTLRRLVKELFFKPMMKEYKTGGKNYTSDNYMYKELKLLRICYKEQLKKISQKGYLSLHFTDRIKSRKRRIFQQQYISPIIRWLNESGIELHEENYCPFYFVYAMLTGPFRYRIYQNKRVLIVTCYDDNKRDAITMGLKREGVINVQFLLLSQGGRAMYDKISLYSVKKPVDLVLVGGGIGASNILCQLESLNTVVIDAGYIIECLAYPERKKQRTFCWPDEERNGDYRPI